MIKTGIYAFTNKINGKKYIGQSVNIGDRYTQHKYRYSITKDSGFNSAIHAAFRKYGWEAFDFEILEECAIDFLDERECYYIKKYDTVAPNGYNLTAGSQQKTIDPNYICPICQKTKDKKSRCCFDCYQKQLQTHALLSAESINIDLIYKILDTSFETVARSYGYASGNSIKKRLISLGLPATKESLFEYYQKETGAAHPKIIERCQKEATLSENKRKNSPQPVDQYDLEGNFIQTFPSANVAARQCKLHSGHISEAICGKRKRAGNFIWKRHSKPI